MTFVLILLLSLAGAALAQLPAEQFEAVQATSEAYPTLDFNPINNGFDSPCNTVAWVRCSNTLPNVIGLLFSEQPGVLDGMPVNETLISAHWKPQLTFLERVSFDGQAVTGPFPSSLLTITTLREIHFTGSQLSGDVPDSFSNLTDLRRLRVDNNLLTGALPPSLFSLPLMVRIEVDGNNFVGGIPSAISTLSNLERFDAKNNDLTGTLPDLSSLAVLNEVTLNNNRLCGTPLLPSGVSICDLNVNEFTFPTCGSLPTACQPACGTQTAPSYTCGANTTTTGTTSTSSAITSTTASTGMTSTSTSSSTLATTTTTATATTTPMVTVVGANETASQLVYAGDLSMETGSTMLVQFSRPISVQGILRIAPSVVLRLEGITSSGARATTTTVTVVTADQGVQGKFESVVAVAADSCQTATVDSVTYSTTVSAAISVAGDPCDAGNNRGLSTGAIVGIAIGAVLGGLVLAIGVAVITTRATKHRTQRMNDEIRLESNI